MSFYVSYVARNSQDALAILKEEIHLPTEVVSIITTALNGFVASNVDGPVNVEAIGHFHDNAAFGGVGATNIQKLEVKLLQFRNPMAPLQVVTPAPTVTLPIDPPAPIVEPTPAEAPVIAEDSTSIVEEASAPLVETPTDQSSAATVDTSTVSSAPEVLDPLPEGAATGGTSTLTSSTTSDVSLPSSESAVDTPSDTNS